MRFEMLLLLRKYRFHDQLLGCPYRLVFFSFFRSSLFVFCCFSLSLFSSIVVVRPRFERARFILNKGGASEHPKFNKNEIP